MPITLDAPAYPKFVYGSGPTTLNFNSYPFAQDEEHEAVRGDAQPHEVNNNSSQHVSVWFRDREFIVLHCQFITTSDKGDFWTWWDTVSAGMSFSFYPDKDLTDYYTVKVADDMEEFSPDEKYAGRWFFIIKLRVIS